KPIPTSFARENYFAITAYKFTNAEGVSKFGRYRILPVDGTEYLDDAATAKKDGNFLFDELKARIAREPVRMKVVVQLANSDDVVDDATIQWPENRLTVNFGTLELTSTVENDAAEQQKIIFDPIPRVDGIEASADPLLDPRANLYLASGRRR